MIETIEHRGEKIYLKKDWTGWRVVYPTNDENGKIIWANFLFGGWRNLFKLIAMLLLIALMFAYIQSEIKDYKEYCEYFSENPVEFCYEVGFFSSLADIGNKGYQPESFDVNISSDIQGGLK